MKFEQLTAELDTQGYCRLGNAYNQQQLQALKTESEAMIERFYNQEELARHSVYPSDSTETRVSHALMIAEGPSPLPKVDHSDYPMVDQFLRDHNRLLSQVTGETTVPSARCMLNYQNYYAGSKPVAEHFDGEYLYTQRATDTVEFKLLEGILPRYVCVLVIANDNDGRGLELIDNKSHQVFKPELFAGDLVVFDNINLRHRVPSLKHPRTTIGLRNFDHLPLHFAADDSYFLDGHYDAIAEGWVSKEVNTLARMETFMKNEWPELKDQYAHYF